MPFWSLFDRPYFPREFTSNKNNRQKKLLIIAIIIYNWPHKNINAIIQFLKKEARHDKILHKRNRRQKGTINMSGWAVKSTHRSYWCLLNAIINMSGGKKLLNSIFSPPLMLMIAFSKHQYERHRLKWSKIKKK